MKSIIKNEEVNQESEYPRLMQSSNTGYERVILFVKPGEGTCVCAIGENTKLGEYYSDWQMDQFKPFNGTIELSN